MGRRNMRTGRVLRTLRHKAAWLIPGIAPEDYARGEGEDGEYSPTSYEMEQRRRMRKMGAVLCSLFFAMGVSALVIVSVTVPKPPPSSGQPQMHSPDQAGGGGQGNAEGGGVRGSDKWESTQAGEDNHRSDPPDRPKQPTPEPFPTDGGDPEAAVEVKLSLEELHAMIASVGTNHQIFNDPTSPQFKALKWLESDVGNSPVYNANVTRKHHIMQRYVLATLFYSAGALSWLNADGWLTPDPECKWYGVHCKSHDMDEHGALGGDAETTGTHTHVVYLDLANNKLVGTVPLELDHLELLEHLHMQANQISGTIPTTITALSNLKTVYLDENALSGPIPTGIGNMINLENIHLGSNKLTGTIPNSIGDLDNLVDLRLFDNDFTGEFPPEIANLENLEVLQLEMNSIEGTLPVDINWMKSLRVLRLHKNSMFGDLPSLAALTGLEELHLDGNAFGGTIHPDLAPASLKELLLSGNAITGTINTGLFRLTKLVDMRLSGNHLTGTIPATIRGLSSLTKLYLDHNVLSGTVPEGLGDIVPLDLVRLEGNSLTGIMPGTVCNLSLKVLTADCKNPANGIQCDDDCCTSCY